MLVQLLEKFGSEQFGLMAGHLQRILYGHFRRIGQFNKALVTGSPFAVDDHEEDNHKSCTFGQWYYAQKASELTGNKEFIALGEIHADLHAIMHTLLRQTGNGRSITVEEYDSFLMTYNLFTDRLTDLINDIHYAQFQFDHLTNLLNRGAFKKILEYELSLLQRHNQPCTIAMADIDHFKNVNDEHGHMNGDIVLKHMAGFFHQELRGYDTVGRFGGEEFIFCLPDAAPSSAKNVMDRLRAHVERLEIPLNDGTIIHVTISIGMAELLEGSTIDETLQNVDRALYQAKSSGRNRVALWGE